MVIRDIKIKKKEIFPKFTNFLLKSSLHSFFFYFFLLIMSGLGCLASEKSASQKINFLEKKRDRLGFARVAFFKRLQKNDIKSWLYVL